MFFFFFNDTATTEIYTLSLHDALPILRRRRSGAPFAVAEPDDCDEEQQLDRREHGRRPPEDVGEEHVGGPREVGARSEEHTSELQSLAYLVCRLLLEKKKKIRRYSYDV